VAKVYYTLLSGESPGPEVADAFRSATGFLRSALARELRVRQVPELRFLPDEALSRGRSLEALIEKAVSRDASSDEKPGSEGS
jgi:ribosome-binding factor A